jgi:maltose alpha-D-glucosyltransferase/alpha-amylase
MGDNVYLGDRNGVRTPMQWSADRNAGFSRANPQKLYLPIISDPEYHYEAIHVDSQQHNPHSLLWWMKRLIALRKRHKAFGQGTIEFLQPDNHKVLAFLRRYENECLLVVANLSRFVQYVELDLSAFQGIRPIEMFGRVVFPPIGDLPYLLTLAPHTFYWFSMSAAPRTRGETSADRLPASASSSWDALSGRAKGDADAAPSYLRGRRWFGGKVRQMRSTLIPEVVRFPFSSSLRT